MSERTRVSVVQTRRFLRPTHPLLVSMWSGGSGRSRERCDRSRSRLAAARSSRLRVEIARG
eukprot:2373707-Lingulodinium_polyedra.AAC.1